MKIFSGHKQRLKWLEGEFLRLAKACESQEEVHSLVAWLMGYGFSLGFAPDELLAHLPERYVTLARDLSDEQIHQGKYPPEFRQGQSVEVVVNAKNITCHRGEVAELTWHHKQRKWFYSIKEDGRLISKRYFAEDLQGIDV